MLNSLQNHFKNRRFNQLRKKASKISQHADTFTNFIESDFKGLTANFKQRLSNGESLENIIPEALAAAGELIRRNLSISLHAEQLIGALGLFDGKLIEMQTGEGKTLTAILAAYLEVIEGRRVHIVTANDYLAHRDAATAAKILVPLGVTLGASSSATPADMKKEVYASNIVYSTSSVLAFDHLNESFAPSLEAKVMGSLDCAIVDEADFVLIDEARLPLTLTAPMAVDPGLVEIAAELASSLETESDYEVDAKNRQVHLTERGVDTATQFYISKGLLEVNQDLFAVTHTDLVFRLNAALLAKEIYVKDVNYVVEADAVLPIHELTGRVAPNNRFSDGVHQALEIKEGVSVKPENSPIAEITFQKYFSQYRKLSGMTGTAATDADEFWAVYNLEILCIPTSKPMIREDLPDLVYRTEAEKLNEMLKDVNRRHANAQPILIGTDSVAASEKVSQLLAENNIPHNALSAKNHSDEAMILSNAGRPGAVTVITNMSGRGIDIALGGDLSERLNLLSGFIVNNPKEQALKDWEIDRDKSIEAGGLHVIGLQRHETRRMDRQLMGRAGRQGEPGSSQFYLSLSDSLIQMYAPERVLALMDQFGVEEGDALTHPWVSKAVETAQANLEERNFESRKSLLAFDSVLDEQRKTYFSFRDALLASEDVRDDVLAIIDDAAQAFMAPHAEHFNVNFEWDFEAITAALSESFKIKLTIEEWRTRFEEYSERQMFELITNTLREQYLLKETIASPELLRKVEKAALVHFLGPFWQQHLNSITQLRQGIHLRAFAGKNPVQDFKREAFELFESMVFEYRNKCAAFLIASRIDSDGKLSPE